MGEKADTVFFFFFLNWTDKIIMGQVDLRWKRKQDDLWKIKIFEIWIGMRFFVMTKKKNTFRFFKQKKKKQFVKSATVNLEKMTSDCGDGDFRKVEIDVSPITPFWSCSFKKIWIDCIIRKLSYCMKNNKDSAIPKRCGGRNDDFHFFQNPHKWNFLTNFLKNN